MKIFDQVVAIDQQSQEYYGRKLSNIVFMGMGEPLMNYKNVIAAIDKITGRKGPTDVAATHHFVNIWNSKDDQKNG